MTDDQDDDYPGDHIHEDLDHPDDDDRRGNGGALVHTEPPQGGTVAERKTQIGPPQAPRSVALSVAEAAVSSAAAQQVYMAAMIAQQNPRRETECEARAIALCKNPAFAEKAVYSFPRGGGKNAEGPSIRMAEGLKRIWGHIQSGNYLVSESEEFRVMRCWAWDCQTNIREEMDITFRKLIQRKMGKGPNAKSQWVVPDERDLLELNNRECAKGMRNCIIKLIPREVVLQAMQQVKETMQGVVKQDPKAYLRHVLGGFMALGVGREEIEAMADMKLGELESDVESLIGLGKMLNTMEEGGKPWKYHVERLAKKHQVKGAKTAQAVREKIAERARAAPQGGQPPPAGAAAPERQEGGGGEADQAP